MPELKDQLNLQNIEDNGKITCQLVRLPTIVLTRIDEGTLLPRSNLGPRPLSKKPGTLSKKPGPLSKKSGSLSKKPESLSKKPGPLPKKPGPLSKKLGSLSKKPKLLSKKPLKRLGSNKSKPLLFSKPSVGKVFSADKVDKRPRGRPKKSTLIAANITKLNNITTQTKLGSTKKVSTSKSSLKNTANPVKSEVKNMLKKTMLQKRSKIVIPPAKKAKLTPTNSSKLISPKPKKLTPPKIKIDIPITKPFDTDSSEDEFLYDELIQELENAPMKNLGAVNAALDMAKKQTTPVLEKTVFPDKTTNITLKPNLGNKPPTIVKGGIIKKINLPADLQPIASPSVEHEPKQKVSVEQNKAHKTKLPPKRKHSKVNDLSDSLGPAKKPSPWPVSISPSSKSVTEQNSKGPKKSTPKQKPVNTQSKATDVIKTPQNKKTLTIKSHLSSSDSMNKVDSKPINALGVVKPKIGPKKTAQVVPLLNSTVQEELSDEYTEEETLENDDVEPVEVLQKKVIDVVQNEKSILENTTTPFKSTMSTSNYTKDDEDPHLDLLRILSDDSYEPVVSQQVSKGRNEHPKVNTSGKTIESQPIRNNSFKESSTPTGTNTIEASNGIEEEPPIRTIYEVIGEISLQYPSWNLHIIPETNAFCIAQVTKGRLGLPTLKKCIELDPVDYNAKVYIHQYHIKRFDGVYDSEESIIALIQEINSIKA